MYGDFTLNPFLYRDDVSRVLWQQGRVQLDSDVNEHTEAILRAMRTSMRDLLGPHAGYESSFMITGDGTNQITIGPGHYYVDGIRVSNGGEAQVTRFITVGESGKTAFPGGQPATANNGSFGVLYHEQPHLPGAKVSDFDPQMTQLVYLDVWERHLSAAEDDSLREVALLGPDTASRAVVVWQVKLLGVAAEFSGQFDPYDMLNALLTPGCSLRARAHVNEEIEACVISPEARYRGAQNRLYRVEIHKVGDKGETWIKWSQDNASIVYPVKDVQGTTITLESLGRDDRTAISIGDWVELVDEEVALQVTGSAHELVQVIDIDRSRLEVTVKTAPANTLDPKRRRRAVLRRWATKPIELGLAPGQTQTAWIDLTDGISVQLATRPNALRNFREGDYWLIPARTATGDILWPKENDDSVFLPPHGVQHHYAPLAQWTGTGFKDLRRRYKRWTEA
ncbi:MAG TPA: DUF6519 domain-containing protein [Thermoanaerobaculia bacterium]|nr:DUF6519 domain-containing protein [Thermoanaerobaculia bacterium]